MSENTSEVGSIDKTAPDAQTKRRIEASKKAKPAEKAGKAAGKPKSDSTNKKAEVIASMKPRRRNIG